MSTISIEKLYESYEVVNDNSKKEDAKKVAYQSILDGVNGEEKEKRLASQFISKFFKCFPDLYDVSFNKLLDLCEDDNILIRKQVIQCLPSVGKSVPEYIPKIADTLTQMLVADDNSEVMLIYAGLNNVLKLDFKVALEAIFHQLITQLDEANDLINTYAFKYLNEKLSSDCTLEPEMETFIETSAKKLLTRLVGKEEYSLVVGILSLLKVNSTLIGRQKLVNELSEQTKSLGKIDSAAKFLTLISNCKQTVKLLSKNVHADDLIMYLLDNVTVMSKLSETNANCSLQDLLKCIIDIAYRGKNVDGGTQISTLTFNSEEALKSLEGLFKLVLEQLPVIPEEVNEEVILKLSEDKSKLSLQEASLLALYCLCKSKPESFTNQNVESLKEFRQKLQFLARVNQAASKSLSDVVTKSSKAEQKTDEGKERSQFSKVTSNLQILIREMFKTSPTFKTVIIPSWNTTATVEPAAAVTVAQTDTVTAPKAVKRGGGIVGGAGPAKTRLLGNNNNSNNYFSRRGRGRGANRR